MAGKSVPVSSSPAYGLYLLVFACLFASTAIFLSWRTAISSDVYFPEEGGDESFIRTDNPIALVPPTPPAPVNRAPPQAPKSVLAQPAPIPVANVSTSKRLCPRFHFGSFWYLNAPSIACISYWAAQPLPANVVRDAGGLATEEVFPVLNGTLLGAAAKPFTIRGYVAVAAPFDLSLAAVLLRAAAASSVLPPPSANTSAPVWLPKKFLKAWNYSYCEAMSTVEGAAALATRLTQQNSSLQGSPSASVRLSWPLKPGAPPFPVQAAGAAPAVIGGVPYTPPSLLELATAAANYRHLPASATPLSSMVGRGTSAFDRMSRSSTFQNSENLSPSEESGWTLPVGWCSPCSRASVGRRVQRLLAGRTLYIVGDSTARQVYGTLSNFADAGISDAALKHLSKVAVAGPPVPPMDPPPPAPKPMAPPITTAILEHIVSMRGQYKPTLQAANVARALPTVNPYKLYATMANASAPLVETIDALDNAIAGTDDNIISLWCKPHVHYHEKMQPTSSCGRAARGNLLLFSWKSFAGRYAFEDADIVQRAVAAKVDVVVITSGMHDCFFNVGAVATMKQNEILLKGLFERLLVRLRNAGIPVIFLTATAAEKLHYVRHCLERYVKSVRMLAAEYAVIADRYSAHSRLPLEIHPDGPHHGDDFMVPLALQIAYLVDAVISRAPHTQCRNVTLTEYSNITQAD